MKPTLPSIGLFAAACAAQPFVAGDPVIHVLVQFPALLATGYLLAPASFRQWDGAAGPLLVLVLVTLAIWMLPRSVDAAVNSWSGHLAKFITIPAGAGFPLGAIWQRLGPILRGFLKAQAVSMLLFLAFLYTHSPVRLCNSYLVDDQVRLGIGFACVGPGLVVWWACPVFLGRTRTSAKENTQ